MCESHEIACRLIHNLNELMCFHQSKIYYKYHSKCISLYTKIKIKCTQCAVTPINDLCFVDQISAVVHTLGLGSDSKTFFNFSQINV